MTVFVADDEKLILNHNARMLRELLPDAELFAFSESQALIAQMKSVVPDIAFLDINMPVINGVDLAQRIKLMNPRVNIIFVTAYDNYKSDAMDMFASGYITKPVSKTEIQRMLDNLRYPVVYSKEKLRVRTFGIFAVYAHGKGVFFHRSKGKEILAYLIYKRGKTVSYDELAAAVFDDPGYSPATKRLMDVNLRSLQDDMAAIGCPELLIHGEGCIAFNGENIKCDLYDYLDGVPDSDRLYNGQFMEPYAWTNAFKEAHS